MYDKEYLDGMGMSAPPQPAKGEKKSSPSLLIGIVIGLGISVIVVGVSLVLLLLLRPNLKKPREVEVVEPAQEVEVVEPVQEVQLEENFQAMVFAESNAILSGTSYRAQAMVTACPNIQTTAKVRLDGGAEREYTSNSQGVIDLDFNVGVGAHKYTGVIQMRNPKTDELEDYAFENAFFVVPPSVIVSATKMNVVYAGVDNPIAIGGGVGGELTATATGATLTKTGAGTYNLRVNGDQREVTVNVSSQGHTLGSMKFRVKSLPNPIVKIDNIGADGKVTKQALLNAGSVRAELKDFDYDGIRYDVVGYTMKYKTKAGTIKEEIVSGSRFNEPIRTVINNSNFGDLLLFTSIQVKGNDGKVKVLDSQIGVEIK